MAYSLSTSWNAQNHSNARDMIAEIRSAGFDTVELGFTLSAGFVQEIHRLRLDGLIKVSSLHNMCPLPDGISPDKASPDYYPLSSCDGIERDLAVRSAIETIRCAGSLGARAVVLHAGRLPIKDRTRELAGLVADRDASDALRLEMIDERARQGAVYLKNAISSLEEIVRFAKGSGVDVGIENRYYYREIPVIDELGEIFERFKPGDLYYWHDVGHAEVFDRLGLGSHSELLKRFGPRLIGMHLHDIIGPMTDHRCPGTGSFDFGLLRPFIKPSTILVMEVHAPASADELRRSAAHLDKALAGGPRGPI